MIDPKSLRIGNTVNFGGRPISLTAEDMVYLLTMQAKIQATNNYQPIPLSEQELIRLGFTWFDEEEKNYEWGYEKGRFRLSEMDFADGDHYYAFNNSYSDVEVRYVHQLQNLYYSLTGEELTYKVDSGLTPTEPDTKE